MFQHQPAAGTRSLQQQQQGWLRQRRLRYGRGGAGSATDPRPGHLKVTATFIPPLARDCEHAGLIGVSVSGREPSISSDTRTDSSTDSCSHRSSRSRGLHQSTSSRLSCESQTTVVGNHDNSSPLGSDAGGNHAVSSGWCSLRAQLCYAAKLHSCATQLRYTDMLHSYTTTLHSYTTQLHNNATQQRYIATQHATQQHYTATQQRYIATQNSDVTQRRCTAMLCSYI